MCVCKHSYGNYTSVFCDLCATRSFQRDFFYSRQSLCLYSKIEIDYKSSIFSRIYLRTPIEIIVKLVNNICSIAMVVFIFKSIAKRTFEF